MLVIGLTGGIASGKTTVANEFAKLGINIIDTDQLAREVVEPGQSALNQIVQHFGQAILLSNGSLDRKKLRALIFANPQEKEWLENLLHPLIRALMKERIALSYSPYCIAVIPLLIEKQPNPLVQRILVVDSDPILQEQRLLQRDNIDMKQAKQMFASQATRAQRLAKADDIILNDGSIDSLTKQVLQLHEYYLKLAYEV